MTKHAKEQAARRGVDEEDIDRIVNSPSETIYDDYHGNYKSFGEVINDYVKGRRYIIIVHTKFNKYVKIITVLMTDKGGVKADGFSKI